MKFDMHCHTAEGSMDAKVPIEQYIARLKSMGFDGMLVSDHNSYNGYRYWRSHIKGKRFNDFVVLRGIEYDTIDAGHILVIMPENVKLPILELRGLPVRLLIDLVHRHGGILGPAHPCGERYLSITNTGRFRRNQDIMNEFDFIEGFNACEEIEDSKKSYKLAEKFKKPVFGGSDAHKMGCVGMGYTEFDGNIRTESDLIRLLREKGRKATSCGGERFIGTTKDKLGRANTILVQSFWFYNRFCGIWRSRSRHRELKRMYIKLR